MGIYFSLVATGTIADVIFVNNFHICLDWDGYKAISDCKFTKLLVDLVCFPDVERHRWCLSKLFGELRSRLIHLIEHSCKLRVPALKSSVDIGALDPDTLWRHQFVSAKFICEDGKVVPSKKESLSHALGSKHLCSLLKHWVRHHWCSCSVSHNFKHVLQIKVILIYFQSSS